MTKTKASIPPKGVLVKGKDVDEAELQRQTFASTGRIVSFSANRFANSEETVPSPPPPTIYKAVATASGATVGASAQSFGAALRDAGLNGSWADNAEAGAEYDGIRLVKG